MYELSISKRYPVDKYNLLGNTDVIVQVPDIMSPVIQEVKLETNPSKSEVYIQQKAKNGWTDKKTGEFHPATPELYAIAKNGLNKLANGAGIKTASSEHVIPSTCQKCVAVNQNVGKIVQCGMCGNRDVAFRVTILVPQLTGEILIVQDTHEIIVNNVIPGMTDRQRAEFMKHLPQICEAKALNGAIRTALHIKGTYTLEELKKPFVVAYLVPNMNHDEVKKAAISSMFHSSQRLFGSAPSIQQIESRVPDNHMAAIEATDGEDFDQYIDGTYLVDGEGTRQEPPAQRDPAYGDNEIRANDFYCDKCGEPVAQNVWDYSVDKFGRPLCYKCQKIVREQMRGGAAR